MIEAYKDFWRQYANFWGRTRRPGYWWVMLWHFIIYTVLYLLLAGFGGERQLLHGGPLVLPVGLILFVLWLYSLAVIVPNIALLVRRLRDAGYYWAWIFLGLLPFFGHIVLLVMLLQGSRWNWEDRL